MLYRMKSTQFQSVAFTWIYGAGSCFFDRKKMGKRLADVGCKGSN